VDARSLREQRDGLATYLGEVVPRMVDRAVDVEVTILANPAKAAFWASAAPRARVVASEVRPMWPGQQWQVPRVVRPLRPDAYFYPVHDPPAMVGVPLVFVVQDLAALELRPYHQRLDRAKRVYSRAVTAVALRRASRVLVPTHATKAAIGRVFGAGFLDRVDIIPFGHRSHEPNGRPAATAAATLLYVGTDQPQKNLPRLVLAYAEARARVPELPDLEVVGRLRRGAELQRVIDTTPARGHVRLLGHVSDAELDRAYERAVALVVPSLLEGFGLPVLEAMARSVPVVTSNQSACAEVAGPAAVLVDPLDVASIAEGIAAVVSRPDLRDDLVARGRERLRRFSWDRCAADTLEALTRAADR